MMGINYQIFDSAHKYGFDNMSATPALISRNTELLGSVLQTTNSWGNDAPGIGGLGIITTTYSGGITQKIALVNLDNHSVSLSFLQLLKTDTAEILIYTTGSIVFDLATMAKTFQTANLYAGADVVNGNSYNNTLTGFAGNDRIDGGAGIDTVVYSGMFSQYSIQKSGSAISTNGPDGLDTLLNVERLQFDDRVIAYDISGNAGKAYRIYQAAFDRAPDKDGLGYWINVLDKGGALGDVAAGFLSSFEFVAANGAHNTSDGIVTRFYQNVLHRNPDQGGLNYWKNLLDTHSLTPSDVLTSFSESPENQINLIGVVQNGIEYYAHS